MPAIITGLLLVGYAAWHNSHRERPVRTGWWLTGLVFLGLCWSVAVISASPAGGGMGRSVFVIFYPRTSGYFHQALYEAEDLSQFLHEYEEGISDKADPDNYLHIGIHRDLLALCPGGFNLSTEIRRQLSLPGDVLAALVAEGTGEKQLLLRQLNGNSVYLLCFAKFSVCDNRSRPLLADALLPSEV